MKKWIYLTMILVACVGCEKDLETYKGECGIYFDTKGIVLDTLYVSWGRYNSNVQEQEFELKVRLFGHTTEYDRKFNIELTADENEDGQNFAAESGIDYELPATEYVIKANETETIVPITLKRRPNLTDHPKRFTVKLIENEELKFLYSREVSLTGNTDDEVFTRQLDYHRVVYMHESFPMPEWWFAYGDEIFGTWSERKSALICDQMGIDRTEWIEMSGSVTIGFLRYCGRKMHRWLLDNPQEEADGTPMQMGPSSNV